MIELIRRHQKELNDLCAKYHVKHLEVFGSAANGVEFDEKKSDLDFCVEFLPLQPGDHADHYFGLHEALEELFGCPIDLVMVRAIKNPYFLEAINKTREMLYAA